MDDLSGGPTPPSVIYEQETLFQSDRVRGIDMILIHAISEEIWWPEDLSGTASRHVPVLEWLTEPVAGRRNGVSAHCFIDTDGTIHTLCRDERKAWHAGVSSHDGEDDLNQNSLGVELVVQGRHDYGSFLRMITTDCYTKPQYHALGWLINDWMTNHPAITYDRVLGHSDVAGDDVRGAGNGKRDPGPGFNWQRAWREFEQWSDEL